MALLLACCATAFKDSAPPLVGQAAGAGWQVARPAEVGLDPARLRGLAAAIGKLGFIRAFLVARNGCLVAEHYRRDHAQGDPQPLHSVAKSVTSAIVGAALRDGLIGDLDRPVAELLPPELAARLAGDRPPITLRHLLTMTSGLASTEFDFNHFEWRSSSDPALALLERERVFPAGSRYRYGTGNAHLLGVAVATASGRSLAEYAQTALFGPAGIVVSRWERDATGRHFGGIEMSMTPRHLARFAQLYAREGMLGGRRILPAAWIEESGRERARTLPAEVHGGEFGYGYLWWLDTVAGHRVLIARGYGDQTLHVVPARDLVVVTNGDWFALDNAVMRRGIALRAMIRGWLEATLPRLASGPAGRRCPI